MFYQAVTESACLLVIGKVIVVTIPKEVTS